MHKCKKHDRYNCYDHQCKRDDDQPGSYYSHNNAGQVGIDSSGHASIGLGGGLGIDLSNGDLTIGGIDIGGGF